MTARLSSIEAQCLHARVFVSDTQRDECAAVNATQELDAYVVAARAYVERWYPEAQDDVPRA